MNDSILLTKALIFAAEKHLSQSRRDGSAYIFHPIKVAEIVRDAGFGAKHQIAALLHDTLEDTDATEEEIRFFGDDVYDAVRLLTRPEGTAENTYIEKILSNHMAAVIKAADKIHNMWECSLCGDVCWAAQYAKKSKQYYFGKFNKAVDTAIDSALLSISHPLNPKKDFSFAKEDMKLYSEIYCEKYLQAKQKYNPEVKPDREGDEIYYKVDMGGFLVIENNRFFELQPYGWEEMMENPIFQTKTPYEEYPMSNKNAFEVFIAHELAKRNFFFDFVDISRL